MSARPEVIVPPPREGSARDVVEVPTDAEVIASLKRERDQWKTRAEDAERVVLNLRDVVAHSHAQIDSLCGARDAATARALKAESELDAARAERDETQKEREDWKACAVRAEQAETELEAQLASLTLDRDAARELLDAETSRLEAKVSRLKRAVVVLAETLFEELRP